MRNAFIEGLCSYARESSDVILLVADLGYSVIEPFADQFPERFYNCGVAEQNMAGVAAGMASEGCHVFTYSIANFPTFRCAEQIRNDIDYHNVPVTTVAVGGGLAYGNMGYSHHAIQDLALMRLFPNHVICAPADAQEVFACMDFLSNAPQPSYLRLGRNDSFSCHNSKPTLELGHWNFCFGNPSSKKIFLATGGGVAIARNLLNGDSRYQDWGVYSLPLWGMKFKKDQARKILDSLELIVTVEDHIEDGGFGSWFKESLSDVCLDKTKIKSINLSSRVSSEVGSQDYLLNKYLNIPCF